ncbi:nuclear transport factor 2 family protein [Pontibacter qinzhouensis]|uniref:Nuclear transport factor 2 family protein n=1 Tax=Pontibacter qinzhouensis TaxID=2603253 RepID=A0A5C8KEA6_9BACT|nr:nuclear transport factor 2 family protein [Pontibacter qinzhouensis]TXK50517.1 nuclear transport factor 2 family protein [Pontibacter qinzhouensis]
MKSFIFSIVITVMLASCAGNNEGVNVQALNQEFISAWNNKDVAGLEAMLAEDVHFLQGEVHYRGKAEVAKNWVRETTGTISDLKTNVVSSASDSQMAYEGGTYSVDVLPAGPDQPYGIGEGNFMLLWKKGTDGAWKLSYAQLEGLPVQVKNR